MHPRGLLSFEAVSSSEPRYNPFRKQLAEGLLPFRRNTAVCSVLYSAVPSLSQVARTPFKPNAANIVQASCVNAFADTKNSV